MTLLLDDNIANVNLVLKFMGALDREDYLLCRVIKDKLEIRIGDDQEINNLKIFVYSCTGKIENELCLHTAKMLDSLKV